MKPSAGQNTPTEIARLRHPAPLVFLMGGAVGAALNFLTTFLLSSKTGLSPWASFFFGTLVNQLFHHYWYHVVYVNREIRIKTSLPLHLSLYFCVAIFSAFLFDFLLGGIKLPFVVLQLPFMTAFFASLLALSLLNVLLIRISTFSSTHLAKVEYRGMNESYYDDQTDVRKVSRFRAWYHRSRYERMTRFVGEYFRAGDRMADLGCANCWWNIHHLPVFGIDINGKMLRWAKKNKRLRGYRVAADLSKTGLKSKSLDLVLMSETLEHLFNLREVLAEVGRILRDKGTFLITVPYDFFLGPFFILFNLNCLYMGYLRGSLYHKYRCGHINHFTKARLRDVLDENGFELKRCFVVNGLLLYAVAAKKGRNEKGVQPNPRTF